MVMSFISKSVAVVASLVGVASWSVNAQTIIPHTTITSVGTGWGADSFALWITSPIPNPANCPSVDLVSSISTDPGYKTYYAAALTAWATNSPVTIIVSNTQCTENRPRIIAVNLEH
jgi:hypothetical protein